MATTNSTDSTAAPVSTVGITPASEYELRFARLNSPAEIAERLLHDVALGVDITDRAYSTAAGGIGYTETRHTPDHNVLNLFRNIEEILGSAEWSLSIEAGLKRIVELGGKRAAPPVVGYAPANMGTATHYVLATDAFNGATSELEGFAAILHTMANVDDDGDALATIADSLKRIMLNLAAADFVASVPAAGGASHG